MSETILVIGASGLLGREVFKYLSNINTFTVIGTACNRVTDKLIQLDSTKEEEVLKAIEHYKPSCVINCAAIRYPDKIEKYKELSESLNIKSVETLCKLCQKEHIYLIHISTDYVFDGKNPPYSPNDHPNPLNEYGKQKYESEKICLQYYSTTTVIRVPILYGPTLSLNESAITILYTLLKQKSISIDNVAIRYPTFTTDIARFIYLLLSTYRDNNEYKGIVHFSANEPFTKYEMCKEMCKLLNIDSTNITPNNTVSNDVPRPKNAHLACEHTVKDKPFEFTSFKDGLTSIFKENHIL